MRFESVRIALHEMPSGMRLSPSFHFIDLIKVVPGSSLELYRDQEYIAYRVVLIKKYAHMFKEPAKLNRFTCREFHYDETEVPSSKIDIFPVLIIEHFCRSQIRLLRSFSFRRNMIICAGIW
jgi:hypothetical protein